MQGQPLPPTLNGKGYAMGDADDFRTRLVEEFSQLKDRLNKLENFTATTQFRDLPVIERAALHEQYGHMRAYYNVLSGRVSRCESA